MIIIIITNYCYILYIVAVNAFKKGSVLLCNSSSSNNNNNNLFIHSYMICRLRARVWTVIRFSSSRSPALWATDTSSSTRAHSYQIYSGVYALQTAAIRIFPSAQCWQNSLATFIFLFCWLGIQAIFRIVPGGVDFTFCSRSPDHQL